MAARCSSLEELCRPNVTGTAVTMPPTPHVEHYLVGSGGPPADATVTAELINSNECRDDRKRVGKCRVERVTFGGDAVFSYSNIPTLAHPHTHTRFCMNAPTRPWLIL